MTEFEKKSLYPPQLFCAYKSFISCDINRIECCQSVTCPNIAESRKKDHLPARAKVGDTMRTGKKSLDCFSVQVGQKRHFNR